MGLPGDRGNQKRTSDPLVLDLQIVVNHVGAENQFKSSARATCAFNC